MLRFLPWRLIGVAVAAALVTSGVWWVLGILPGGHDASAPAAASDEKVELLDPGNGVDPMWTECRDDAVIAASEPRFGDSVQVQLLYSKQCMAVWGRVTRYDGEAANNFVSMQIYPAAEIGSDRDQERKAQDAQSVYTTMLIEPDVDARVCGIATISSEGEKIELAPPICV